MVGQHRPQLQCVIGDEMRIGGVAESLPVDEAPRPARHVALLAAYGGVDAEAGDDVPGTTCGEAEEHHDKNLPCIFFFSNSYSISNNI